MTDLILRAPEERDVPDLTELLGLPGVRHGTARLPYADPGQVRARILHPDPQHVPLVAERAGKAIGQATLVRGENRRAHSAELRLIVHDDHARQGVGRALFGALVRLADEDLGLTRLWLHVMCDNRGAIALYESFGFEVVGRMRGYTIREGQLVDSHLMDRLRPAPVRAPDQP